MKTFITVILSLLLCYSCIKEEENSPDYTGKDTEIALSFVISNPTKTRGFGDNTATAAEKKVTNAKLFIFKSGNKIFEKYLTSSKLSSIGNQAITFPVPGLNASTQYDFYIIINNGDVAASNLTALKAITQSDIVSYNGPWNTVYDAASAPRRPNGFVMTGNSSYTTTTDLSQTQNVTIGVKRITAKVDIDINIDNTVFGTGNVYPGSMTFDSTFITKTQATTPLIPGTPTTTPGTLSLPKQIPNAAGANSNYQNRFYLFENGALNTGSRVILTLYGTYTEDGVATPVIYTTELSGTSNGNIVRNGSYHVIAKIIGLTGSSIALTVTLSDWETIVTQTANLGS